MIAIADEAGVYLLEFIDRRGLEREVERLRKHLKAAIVPGHTAVIASIEQELAAYFKGTLANFTTPSHFIGSSFQQRVWQALQAIPVGETRSYSTLAQAIGQPSAVRAVANANGANTLALIIPCHRVIQANGELGGYGGGIARKQWLLKHERERNINHDVSIHHIFPYLA